MHAEHAIGRFEHGGLARACRVMAAVIRSNIVTDVRLQPLRIHPDWTIDWNAFFEVDPTPETIAAGYFGGSSLFAAHSTDLRLAIDVEWRPEDDLEGQYHLTVYYAPWPRTETGRRRKSVPVDFRHSKVVHSLDTQCREQVVSELEIVFAEGRKWSEKS